MTTKNYFETELHVHFTRSELSSIMHALADFSFCEHNEQRFNNSKNALALREKVRRFADLYDNSAVL